MAPRASLWGYWAKADGDAYHAVPAHLLDVAAVLVAYLEGHPRMRASWAEHFALPESVLPRFLAWWTATHDIGKLCDRFQACHPEMFARLFPGARARPYSPHHTTLGSVALRGSLMRSRVEAWTRAGHPWPATRWTHILNAIEAPFTGHHGQPPEAVDAPVVDFWDAAGLYAAAEWLDELDSLFGGGPWWDGNLAATDVLNRIRAASWHIAGLVVMSDWIGSGPWFRPAHEPQPTRDYWESTLKVARGAIAEVGVLPVAVAPPRDMSSMFGCDPTPLQRAIEAWAPGEGPHLVIVEDATGSGKTEASILAAHRAMASGAADGFYFGLPSQATANAMYERIAVAGGRLFERPADASLVLAHSGKLALKAFREDAWRLIAETGQGRDEGRLECSAWLKDSRKKAFLSHGGVGTLDQALMGVLPVRHQALRLFGLTSRVLIVDEVHAYDPLATRLLEELLRFHTRAGGTTLLLSATIPGNLRRRLVDVFAAEAKANDVTLRSSAYPLLTLVDRTGAREIDLEPSARSTKRFGIQWSSSFEDTLQHARAAAAAGACVCWVRNTVDEAIDAWERLRDDGAALLHARFTESHRREKENGLKAWAGKDSRADDRRGRILVATQVVEQSLDVDFDVMISDLAPIELLVQRAGRLHRHADRARPASYESPVLTIHGPPWSDEPREDWVSAWSPGTRAVYPDAGRLWLSAQAARDAQTIRIPEDARRVIEHVHGLDAEERIPKALARATAEAEGDRGKARAIAHTHALDLAAGYRLRDAKWEQPDRARTRDGERSVDVHLAVEREGGLFPLTPAAEGWDGARVRVRLERAARSGLLDDDDRGSKSPGGVPNILAMTQTGAAEWRTTRSHGGHRFAITYTTERGLDIKEEDA